MILHNTIAKRAKSAISVLIGGLLAMTQANAVVIRADVPDTPYRVAASAYPALVDLPMEGHGSLIAPRWIVTAAHAVRFGMPKQASIHGTPRAVAAMYVYPDFHMPNVPAQGDAAPVMAALSAMHDIALIKLAEPVSDVQPVVLYQGSDEQGKVGELIGKGATGDGQRGQQSGSPHRGVLRRAYNRMQVSANGLWLDYRFDCDADALPLEGVMGDGDSGGPLLIEQAGVWKLAGLASWKHWQGDIAAFRAGVCGQVFSNTRLSHYAGWIADTMAAHP